MNQLNIILISNLLVIIGAFNWLGVGLTNTDYVSKLIGYEYSKYIFIIVGLAGFYVAYNTFIFYGLASILTTKEHMSVCGTVNGKLVCKNKLNTKHVQVS